MRFELERFTESLEPYEDAGDPEIVEGTEETLIRTWHFRNRDLFCR